MPQPAHEVPIVAIGASAGGLDALCTFFDHMPADRGIAFIVVTHHRADAPSLLPEILARHTRMVVVDAHHEMEILPDRVHVIPPGAGAALRGKLLLLDGERVAGRLVRPIDGLFRSLASERGERAIAVILSGTGNDGSVGAAEIRRRGGFTLAQDAAAAYRDMPENAIAMGGIDRVLPVESCPAAIVARVAGERGPVAEASVPAGLAPGDADDAALAAIVAEVKRVTGHDVSTYKDEVLRRRVAHRMMLRRSGSLSEYARSLNGAADEPQRLWQELLIGVTEFFRDARAFDELGRALDAILVSRPVGAVVRAWVAGCATGEEAFSIAIALRESMERMGVSPEMRVLATDLDPGAIEFARAGIFPESATATVSPQRLRRFFVRVPGGYAIHPEIQSAVEFTTHNLATHPAPAQGNEVDLVSCRNVLIFLKRQAQRDVLDRLHRAMKPGGLLFLGQAESLDTLAGRFEPVHRGWRIFRRLDGGTPVTPPLARPPRTRAAVDRAPRAEAGAALVRLLADRFAPPSALVDESGDILELFGPLEDYLQPAERSTGAGNLLRRARSGLQGELALAIRTAAETGEVAVRPAVPFAGAAGPALVDVQAQRTDRPQLGGLVLVSFLAPTTSGSAARQDALTAHQELQIVNQELLSMNDELRATNLDLERSLEGLSARTRELEAANAELRGLRRRGGDR